MGRVAFVWIGWDMELQSAVCGGKLFTFSYFCHKLFLELRPCLAVLDLICSFVQLFEEEIVGF